MEKNTPRRMRRFHRKTEQKPLLDKLKSLSRPKKKFLSELKVRKETPDDMAETLFEQIKEKEEKQKRKTEEKKKKIPAGKKESKSMQGKQEEEIPLWKKKRMERLEQQGEKTGEKKEETEKTPRKHERKGKEEKKQAQRTHGRNRAGKEEAKKIIEELPAFKGKKITGLFGEEKKSEKETDETEEDELEELDEEGEEKLFDLEDEEEKAEESGETENEETKEFDEITGTMKKNKCINCKKEFNELIFCASCGNAFCDKCAKIKQKEGNKTKYVCPHCGFVTKK